MYDAHGKEYLDFAAGIAVNSLGMAALTRKFELSYSCLLNNLNLVFQRILLTVHVVLKMFRFKLNGVFNADFMNKIVGRTWG